jgi:hypothetical protein
MSVGKSVVNYLWELADRMDVRISEMLIDFNK